MLANINFYIKGGINMAKVVSAKELEKMSGGLQVKHLRDSGFGGHFVILGSADEVDDWYNFAKGNGLQMPVGIYTGLNGQCVLYEAKDKADAVTQLRAYSGYD